MFYNIFKKTIKSKRQIKQKPKIIADIHEKNSLVLAELESNKEIELTIHPLKVGDYLIGNTIIERKTISDLVSSLVSKRIIEQLKQMKQYKQQLLILEGDLESSNFNQNAIRGFVLSAIINFNIPVIFSKNYEDTANYLITLAKQQLKKQVPVTFHSRIPKTAMEQKKYILESFPNIGPATAEKLLKKFKNLKSIFNAGEEELKEILASKTKDFTWLLHSFQ